MTEPPTGPQATDRRFPHVRVPWHGQDVDYRGRGGGPPSRSHSIFDRRAHAEGLKRDLRDAQNQAQDEQRGFPADLRPDGLLLCAEGWIDEPGYELALASLDADGATLLAVMPPDETRPERAVVWMPEDALGKFLRKLDQYATEETTRGQPKNQKLAANIRSIKRAALAQLWQEETSFPEDAEAHWWELWLARLPQSPDPGEQLVRAASELGLIVGRQRLAFRERAIAMVHGTVEQLGALLTTNCVVAEIHRPLRVDEVFGVDPDTQRELIDHLVERIELAHPLSPAVTQLDTGVASAHRLLRGSIDGMHSVLPGATSADEHGHGTSMAGLALYGDLRGALAGNGIVRLSHRLESVKYVDPTRLESTTAPELYGAVTADAAARVEIDAPARQRVFSMPVTATNGASRGQPSSWSSALDAISFGTDISSSPTGITLLGEPEVAARRLFVVSAGNASYPMHAPTGLPDHLEFCDSQRVEDPGQAWNVLTIGAVTELTDVPQNGSFQNWQPVAPPGELSPYSRTSVLFDGPWPVKPDIVLEGGNLLTDPAGVEQGSHDVVSLLTTSHLGGLTTANATSAATAQAARLAALVMARYPGLWPETIRGLLVHAAEWTPLMRQRIVARGVTKAQRAALLRRYGWGIPTEDRLLYSASSDVTMIIQDEYRPFERERSGVKMRALRLHELPWPREQLLGLLDATVRMRITLSYFVEPNPSSRGWDVRYRYPSHQLRFDVKRPTETVQEFKVRIGREAQLEEENHAPAPSAPDGRWLVGPINRHKGSLHADIWEGSAAELAEGGAIAVVPVGGWWKDHRRRDRANLPVRYALLVSLTSEEITDIYTPITTKIGMPVEIAL